MKDINAKHGKNFNFESLQQEMSDPQKMPNIKKPNPFIRKSKVSSSKTNNNKR